MRPAPAATRRQAEREAKAKEAETPEARKPRPGSTDGCGQMSHAGVMAAMPTCMAKAVSPLIWILPAKNACGAGNAPERI